MNQDSRDEWVVHYGLGHIEVVMARFRKYCEKNALENQFDNKFSSNKM